MSNIDDVRAALGHTLWSRVLTHVLTVGVIVSFVALCVVGVRVLDDYRTTADANEEFAAGAEQADTLSRLVYTMGRSVEFALRLDRQPDARAELERWLATSDRHLSVLDVSVLPAQAQDDIAAVRARRPQIGAALRGHQAGEPASLLLMNHLTASSRDIQQAATVTDQAVANRLSSTLVQGIDEHRRRLATAGGMFTSLMILALLLSVRTRKQSTARLAMARRALAAHTADRARLQARESEITSRARTDPLTGLPNRAALNAILDAGADDPRSTTLLFLDLDNFKVINDSLGHDAGDVVLRAAAERLQRIIGPRHTLIRLGGDEFVVVVDRNHSIGPVAAEALGTQMLEVLARPFAVRGREVHIGGSIGIASSSDGSELSDLLRRADTAMYEAKRTGRDRVQHYTEALDRTAKARLDVEEGLRHSLTLGDFELHAQPVIDLDTGATQTIEMLVRWRHDGQLRFPGEFLAVAEETGMVVPLGRWVLRRSLHQLRAWDTDLRRHDTAAPLSVAVNISARQMADASLVDHVSDALFDTGIEPTRLVLELTESALAGNPEVAARSMSALRDLGVRFAIDGFGAGQSSLSLLTTLPVHELKIDGSIVADVAHDERAGRLFDSIVDIGHKLDMLVVAEAVETSDQLARIRSAGCDRAQGYLWAPPGPTAELVLPPTATSAPSRG